MPIKAKFTSLEPVRSIYFFGTPEMNFQMPEFFAHPVFQQSNYLKQPIVVLCYEKRLSEKYGIIQFLSQSFASKL